MSNKNDDQYRKFLELAANSIEREENERVLKILAEAASPKAPLDYSISPHVGSVTDCRPLSREAFEDVHNQITSMNRRRELLHAFQAVRLRGEPGSSLLSLEDAKEWVKRLDNRIKQHAPETSFFTSPDQVRSTTLPLEGGTPLTMEHIEECAKQIRHVVLAPPLQLERHGYAFEEAAKASASPDDLLKDLPKKTSDEEPSVAPLRLESGRAFSEKLAMKVRARDMLKLHEKIRDMPFFTSPDQVPSVHSGSTPWAELPPEAWQVSERALEVTLDGMTGDTQTLSIGQSLNSEQDCYRIAWSTSTAEQPCETHFRAVRSGIEATYWSIHDTYLRVFGDDLRKKLITLDEMRKLMPRLRLTTSPGEVTSAEVQLFIESIADQDGETFNWRWQNFMTARYDKSTQTLSFDVSQNSYDVLRRVAREAAARSYARWHAKLLKKLEADGNAAERRQTSALATESDKTPLEQYQAAFKGLVKAATDAGWEVKMVTSAGAPKATGPKLPEKMMPIPATAIPSTAHDYHHDLSNPFHVQLAKDEKLRQDLLQQRRNALSRACDAIHCAHTQAFTDIGQRLRTEWKLDGVMSRYDLRIFDDCSEVTIADYFKFVEETLNGRVSERLVVRDEDAELLEQIFTKMRFEAQRAPMEREIQLGPDVVRCQRQRIVFSAVSTRDGLRLWAKTLKLSGWDTWEFEYLKDAERVAWPRKILPAPALVPQVSREELPYALRQTLLQRLRVEDHYRLVGVERLLADEAEREKRTMYGPDLSGSEFELTAEELRDYAAKHGNGGPRGGDPV